MCEAVYFSCSHYEVLSEPALIGPSKWTLWIQAKSCIAPAAWCFPTQGLSPGSINPPGSFLEPELNGSTLLHPWHTSVFWKTLINPLLPQVGHGAGAPLLCFPQCSTDTCFPPLTLQEVASVLVLGKPVEVFTLWLKEGDRQTLLLYLLHSLWNPYFLHFSLGVKIMMQISSLGTMKSPTLPGT